MDENFDQLSKFKAEDKNIQKIITDLLGFFRREAKPQWRDYYERRYLTNEELVDDLEAIGDLKIKGTPYAEDRSKVYTYTFDEQDYKLKEGTRVSVFNNSSNPEETETATIVELDQTRQIVKLKKVLNLV